jgi:hypothetical protein
MMPELDTHGHHGWWPMLAHRRRHVDGTMVGRECFVDMRNGNICEPEDGWSTKDLPYATGETSSFQHHSDAFRRNFDLIDWNRVETPGPEIIRPEIEARRKFVNNYNSIRWDHARQS